MAYGDIVDGGVSVLLGRTLTSVQQKGDEDIEFTTVEGDVFVLTHLQDCCEEVAIDDINGNLDDLVGSPITLADESMSNENPPGIDIPEWQGSFTWTFYRFATVRGYVDVRWYGESNGYYSESVDFVQTRRADDVARPTQ